MLVQVALNVFGSMDLLPFTGVTFPFMSRGGSSLISCWMLLAYIKGSDNRREASFVVRPAEKYSRWEDPRQQEAGTDGKAGGASGKAEVKKA